MTASGCYTFEIEVTNQFYPEIRQQPTPRANSWELDWSDDDSTQDGEMTTC